MRAPPGAGDRRPRGSPGGDRGSVTVIAAAAIAVLLALVLLAADAARLLSAAGRAQTAADAAALAAAQELAIPSAEDPATLAGRYAEANGAVLVWCACPEGGTEAVVRVRAEAGPTFLLPGGRWVEATARAVVDLPAGLTGTGEPSGGPPGTMPQW